jgi:hypothetical protein
MEDAARHLLISDNSKLQTPNLKAVRVARLRFLWRFGVWSLELSDIIE